jgi:PTS system fructose-specific IIB component
MKALPTHTRPESPIIQPESEGATVDESFVVGGPVGDSELLLCHGMVCVVGRMRDLILQLSKSSIYSTKPIRSAFAKNG